jgi:hypothetical protein
MTDNQENLLLLPEEEEQLRALVRSAAAEPPADLGDRVLAGVSAERKRMRAVWIRRVSGIAAAFVLLVPAAAAVLPRMMQNPPAADAGDALCGTADETVPAGSADMLYSAADTPLLSAPVPETSAADPAAPAASAAPVAPVAPVAPPIPPEWEAKSAETGAASEAAPLPPPDHMKVPEGYVPQVPTPAQPPAVMDTPAVPTAPAAGINPTVPAAPPEPLYFAVLRDLVGGDALALWADGYEGDLFSAEAETDAYTHFGLDR